MIIGIVSDTHGGEVRLGQAMEIFRQRGAEAIVHCGDIGSPQCVGLLGSAGVPAYAVAGNTDHDLDALGLVAQQTNVVFSDEVAIVPLENGRMLAATHGHLPQALSRVLANEPFPYVCLGHSHRTRDERVGGIRVINPGALFNCRHPSYPTVAILDTAGDSVEFVRVPAAAAH